MARATRASTRSVSTALKATTPSKQNQKSATPKSKVKKEDTGAENAAVKEAQEDDDDDDTPRSNTRGAKRGASAIDARSSSNGAKRQIKRVKKEENDEEDENESLSSSGEASDGDVESSILESDEESEGNSDDYQKPTKTGQQKQKQKQKQTTKKESSTPTKSKKVTVKSESTPDSKSKNKTKSATPAKDLSSKKLDAYFKNANQSPFPDFPHPTASEAKLAHRILSSLHGARTRPEKVVASTESAGCGDSPSVLDALVRTILSQNTSDKNSTRAKKSMDAVYGGSDRWDEIVEGGQSKLQEAIKSGGLSVTKSKVIISILQQAQEKYGKYSLDHLFEASNEDAMREMLSFQGVGPKTASCVLLFCLQRESFAVDTHVHRITGLLGWRPKNANREETHSHLDVMIPDEDKYGLHILLVKHGKVCDECKAGGKNLGKCELRKAFRQGKIKGEAGDDVKEEEVERVKEEDGDESEWFGV